MKAVITGDIVNSRYVKVDEWMSSFTELAAQEKVDWEIYRGDSFQLITSPKEALKYALTLKSAIKQVKEIDVRMAIGIGEISYQGTRITESNGSAFIHSGECFDNLKKDKLAIKTPWSKFDRAMNLMLNLTALTIDDWTPATSRVINEILKNPEFNQTELAKNLDLKSQGAVSEGLKRGGYDEINKLLLYYTDEINELCSS